MAVQWWVYCMLYCVCQSHTTWLDLTWLECLYRNLNLFLWKCTKTVATRAAPFGSDNAPNRLLAGASPQTPLGELTALPRPPSWFRGWGPRGKGRRGREKKGEGGRGGNGGERREREGRESRNAQIQSWQVYSKTYACFFYFSTCFRTLQNCSFVVWSVVLMRSSLLLINVTSPKCQCAVE